MDDRQKGESLADQGEVLVNRLCVNCKTTKTPMWRSGPVGPKSLCNACGIRYKKKSNEAVKKKKKQKAIKKGAEESRKSSGYNGGGVKGKRLRKDIGVRLMALGEEVVLLQRRRSPMMRRQRKILGEVEQAAVLLMTLSCGSLLPFA